MLLRGWFSPVIHQGVILPQPAPSSQDGFHTLLYPHVSERYHNKVLDSVPPPPTSSLPTVHVFIYPFVYLHLLSTYKLYLPYRLRAFPCTYTPRLLVYVPGTLQYLGVSLPGPVRGRAASCLLRSRADTTAGHQHARQEPCWQPRTTTFNLNCSTTITEQLPAYRFISGSKQGTVGAICILALHALARTVGPFTQ